MMTLAQAIATVSEQLRVWKDHDLVMDALRKALDPVPLLLWCPECKERHIDGPATDGTDWSKQVHHTHACQHCGAVWRPAIVPTVGVRFLPGFKNDSAP